MSSTKWRISGEEVVSCDCAWGCPCQFNALPTNGRCEAIASFEIHQGYYGDVSLAGVRFLRVYSSPASIPEGNGTRLTIIDDQASAEQRAALLALDSGQHGGLYFEIFLPSAQMFWSSCLRAWTSSRTASADAPT